jgi:hypothetical protein
MKKSEWELTHSLSRRHRAARGVRAALATGCLLAALTGCGNWVEVHDAGQLGLTVDAAGHPVVAVLLCGTGHPLVDMYEGRKPTDPASKENVERGHWQSRRGFSGVGKLAITAPDTTWKTTHRLAPLEPDRLFLVDGGTTEDDNASLGGINFHTSDLATLTPDVVRVNGRITSWSAFAAYKCR